MEIQNRKCIQGWQGFLARCTAAWLLAGCVTPALAGSGDLDMRFGDNGRLVLPDTPGAPIVQLPDGRLIVVSGNGGPTLDLQRFRANGSPDEQFGPGGRVATPNPNRFVPVAAAVQPDGKLLVGGYRAGDVGVRGATNRVLRLDLSNGVKLDATFGKDGEAETGYLTRILKLLPFTSGDILVLEVASSGDGASRAVAWLDSTGRTTAGWFTEATDLAQLDADSAVLLLEDWSDGELQLMRMRRTGYDQSFGTSGIAKAQMPGEQHMVVDSLGRIVVCAGSELRRYTANGQPDPTFGPDGSGRVYDSVGGAGRDSCRELAADSNGRILKVGGWRPFVVRLGADGSLDPTLNTVSDPPRLHGSGPPTEAWQSLWLQLTPAGDARIAWHVTNGASAVSERVVVDAIDLGSTASSPAVGIASYAPRALERAGFVELPVVRSGPSVGAASVRYEVLAGTADAGDVILASGTLTWAAGDATRRTVRIGITNDTLEEGEETFFVRLRDGVGVTTPAEPLRVTLVDDEALRSLRFSKDAITVQARSAPATWPTLTLDRPSDLPGPVTAYYYMGTVFDYCCEGGARWEPGQLLPQSISLPTALVNHGSSFFVFLVDDEGAEVGPSAKIEVLPAPIPPATPAPTPATPAPSPQPPSAGNGGGGGGAFGLLDLLLASLGAGFFARLRRALVVFRGSMGGTATVLLVAACINAPDANAAPGDLDMRFGDQGRLVVPAANPATALVQQSDGKLLLVDGGSALRIRRFLPNGAPDIQFGQGGQISVPNPVDLVPFAAAIQPDGKLLIAGYRVDDFLVTVAFPCFVIRLDLASAATYDPAFGKDGVVQLGGDSPFHNLLVLPSGDILSIRNENGATSFSRVIARLDSTGRLLNEQASDALDIAPLDSNSAIVLDSSPSNSSYTSLRRLQRTGFDITFGNFGEVPINDMAGELVKVDGLGRIVVCGGAEFRRYTVTGQPDPGFGPSGSGSVRFDSLPGVQMDSCRGLAVDSSGRIVAVGSDLAGAGNELRTFVIRLRSDGSLDPAFGTASGQLVLRGLTPPTQIWRAEWLQLTAGGDARMAWSVTAAAPARGNVVVDAIDLGGDVSTPAVGIPSYEPKAMERAGFVELPVVRSGSSAAPASVRYEVLSGSADASDVELTGGTLNWPAGDGTRRTLRIKMTDDTLNEGEERFSVRLRDGVGLTVPGEPTSITLVDDEALQSLRFDKETIKWVQSPSAPFSTWPKLKLNRPVDAPGPVTAYYYFANGVGGCCVRGVRWEPGQLSPENIFLSQEFGLGNSFYAAVVDDEWQEVGPSATVIVLLESAPPSNPTPPPSVPPTPSSGGGSGSSSGGGGAFGWLDLLLIGLAAGWMLRAELRRAATTARRTHRPHPPQPSDNMAA